LLPIVGAVGFAIPAFATSGFSGGYVKNTYLPSTHNGMDYRITIGGTPTICPGQSFAYINQSDLNYVQMAKTITMMRGLGIFDGVDWTTDASGYCHITGLRGTATNYYSTPPTSGPSSSTQTILGFIGVIFRFLE